VSPDGKRVVTASADATARIWAVETGREEQVLLGHKKGITSVAWGCDGSIATVNFEFEIRIWDEKGTYQRTVPDPDGIAHQYVWRLHFRRDSRRLLCCTGGNVEVGRTACLVDVATGRISSRVPNKNTILSCALSPDGKLAALGGFRGEELKIFSTADG